MISQAEFESQERDLVESVGGKAIDAPTLVIGKWSTTLYGFVEADNIFDTTQSFVDLAGNNQVARPGTLAGNNARYTAGVRNSRIGFRIRAPEFHKVRTSAMIEMDFLGNQAGTSEAAIFTTPVFRVRHMMLKIETPIVDIMFGQYWHLFGWQSLYNPNTVEIQGVPGEIYSRTPQIRLSKTVKTDAITFEAALAMSRSPQRDSIAPEGEAGVRLAFNKWKTLQTMGSTGTTVSPLSIAVTGDIRHFELPEFKSSAVNTVGKNGYAFAVDAFIPIIPVTDSRKSNALSINAEYSWSTGAADLFTQLNGGVSNPALPTPMGATTAPTYNADVDSGLVAVNADGTFNTIQWQSALVGLQYYLPGLNGRSWVSGNYSHMESSNSKYHGSPKSVRSSLDWADANIFADVTPSVRLGLEYAWFHDTYVDGVSADNHRVQFSAFYIF